MRCSIFRPKQAGRICAFCRQQQHQQQPQQRIIAARSLHSSCNATRPRQVSSGSAAISQSSNLSQPSHTRAMPRRRSFTSSARVQVQSTNSTTNSTTTNNNNNNNSNQSNTETTSTTDPPAQEKPTTHYSFFPRTLPSGPPPHGPFEIDTRALRLEFLALQAAAHPDVHPSGPQRLRAQATSARINEAYRGLSDPLQRAQHLLALRGVGAAEDEAARVEDPELLALVLETRERIEDAVAEHQLDGLRRENEERVRDCEVRLAECFARDDVEAASREVVRLRFWRNVRASIEEWERGKPVVLQH